MFSLFKQNLIELVGIISVANFFLVNLSSSAKYNSPLLLLKRQAEVFGPVGLRPRIKNSLFFFIFKKINDCNHTQELKI